jgi:hypothetical protein
MLVMTKHTHLSIPPEEVAQRVVGHQDMNSSKQQGQIQVGAFQAQAA